MTREMAELAAAEGLRAYREELGTRPRVLYKNLHRWDKVFVAANVAYKDTDECAEGAKITVTAAATGAKAGEAVANNYGDVRVDELDPGAEYEVSIDAAGYKPLCDHGQDWTRVATWDWCCWRGASLLRPLVGPV